MKDAHVTGMAFKAPQNVTQDWRLNLMMFHLPSWAPGRFSKMYFLLLYNVKSIKKCQCVGIAHSGEGGTIDQLNI